jgi:hypothetical protein
VGTLTAIAIQAWTAIKTAFAVYNAYSRAVSILETVQDLAIIVAAFANEDPEDDGVIVEILQKWVLARLARAAIGFAVSIAVNAVVGVGGKVAGAVAGRFARKGITLASIQKTKAYYAKFVKPKANTTVTTRSGKVVSYDRHGWPDFRPYLWKGKPNTLKIQLQGNTKKDLDEADRIFFQKTGMSRPAGSTWHHHQDLGTMQLVEQAEHSTRFGGLAHSGGLSILRRLYGAAYK